jgi:5-deoxy-glucuronate isomerase
MDEHLYRAGSLATGSAQVVLDPGTAGWDYSGLVVHSLASGDTITWSTGESENVVLPLTIRGVTVVVRDGGGEHTYELAGRDDVFAGPSDFVYAGRDCEVSVTAAKAGGELAVCSARCDNRLPTVYQPADNVPVELRGAGVCTRQVNNFAAAGEFPCDRMIAVEVITPGGNWSSYPPHKHDEDRPGKESVLEEIYYVRVADGVAPDGTVHPGTGYLHVYGTDDRPIDVLAQVGTGDVVTIPHGWHGPAMATPGYDMYYLNVMAGPSADRAWLIADDPAHGWIRQTWEHQATDPRLPLGGRAPVDDVKTDETESP